MRSSESRKGIADRRRRYPTVAGFETDYSYFKTLVLALKTSRICSEFLDNLNSQAQVLRLYQGTSV